MSQKQKRFEVWCFPSNGRRLWQTNSRLVGWTMLILCTLVCRWDGEVRLLDTVEHTQLASW